jgi:hypothetical protein
MRFPLFLDPIFFNLYNTFNVFKFAMDIQIINRLTGFIIKNPNLVLRVFFFFTSLILNNFTTKNLNTKLKILQFNCPYYEQDDMIATFAFFYPMLIAIGFLFTVISTIGHIVREKATRMKVHFITWKIYSIHH